MFSLGKFLRSRGCEQGDPLCSHGPLHGITGLLLDDASGTLANWTFVSCNEKPGFANFR